MKKSFTILELIFVIVIIGILAGLAVPRLFPVITTSKIKKLQSQLSAIRVAISNAYSKNIISGNNQCPQLEGNKANLLFEGVLTYPITKNKGDIKWDGNGNDYNATIGNIVVKFHYDNNPNNNCKFSCQSVSGTSDYSCSDF